MQEEKKNMKRLRRRTQMAIVKIELRDTTLDATWVRICVDSGGFLKPMWASRVFFDITPSYVASVEIKREILKVMYYADGWENKMKRIKEEFDEAHNRAVSDP